VDLGTNEQQQKKKKTHGKEIYRRLEEKKNQTLDHKATRKHLVNPRTETDSIPKNDNIKRPKQKKRNLTKSLAIAN